MDWTLVDQIGRCMACIQIIPLQYRLFQKAFLVKTFEASWYVLAAGTSRWA